MAKSYRFTPKRRAALRRAQLASAKKRKSSRNKKIGAAVGVIALGAGVAGTAYAVNRKRSRVAGTKTRPISKELVHVPGQGKTFTFVPTKRKPRKNPVPKVAPKRIIKVNKEGVAVKTTRGRLVYDSKRRRQYWQAKPVGGASRKKYSTAKRGRK